MIQRFELTRGVMENIHCPFCGHLVLDMDFTDEQSAKPCEHTLFVAHDFAIEYLSDALKERFKVSDAEYLEQLEELDDFENIDIFTDKIDLKNAIKIAQYEGAPGDNGVYVGFQFIS